MACTYCQRITVGTWRGCEHTPSMTALSDSMENCWLCKTILVSISHEVRSNPVVTPWPIRCVVEIMYGIAMLDIRHAEYRSMGCANHVAIVTNPGEIHACLLR